MFQFQEAVSMVSQKFKKSALISEATAKQNSKYVEVLEPSDLKLRPIVAGPTCPTRPLSDLLDKILKPFILHVWSVSLE